MLNRYPLWKYLLVCLVLAVGFFYAAPNLYGEDPALQVSGSRGHDVALATLDQVKSSLDQAGIKMKSAALDKGQVLVRFNQADDQLRAKDVVTQALGEEYIVALNLAPATPEWLTRLGAGPMKLGLDLRGGVHFLMEVDMTEALSKSMDQTVQDFRTQLREDKVRYAGVRRDGDKVLVAFRDADAQQKGLALLRKQHTDLQFDQYDDQGQFWLKANMSEAKLKERNNFV